MFEGFTPVVDESSLVLILGSFPSVKSRGNNFYYANPQNRIWKIFEVFFNVKVPINAEERREFLLSHNVALWDIVKTAEIKGSSDSKLKEVEINDIEQLLKKYPNIKYVICNGKLSLNLISKYFPNIETTYLPSTSPANVTFKLQTWLDALRNVFELR